LLGDVTKIGGAYHFATNRVTTSVDTDLILVCSGEDHGMSHE